MTATVTNPGRLFRVVRGSLGIGATVRAADAREAVAKDSAAIAGRGPGPLGVFAGVEPAPVVAVYELRELPAADWQ